MKHTKVISVICILFCLIISYISAGEESSFTGILGALDREIILLEDMVLDRQERTIEGIQFITGKIKGRHVVLASTGVGKVNAAMVTTLLIEHFKPEEILFAGIAGGINPDLLPGDIVIAEKTVQHDLGRFTSTGLQNRGVRNPIDGMRNPVFFPADARLLKFAEMSCKHAKLEKITGRIPMVITGIVVTGDMFISSRVKRSELRTQFQADAVEMEGGAVAQICWQRTIPCLVIRSISDTAGDKAVQECEEFSVIAARNSALLVADVIEQLASE